ncbi:MAG TPA: phosphoribosylglycinamide formyltransferase, partial [Euryarchaeota archaeon]|nr:phosphoribosylglycinamide formyltransferase [Euryarchaeota archaeon]
MKNIAVLISGGGSNLQSLIDAVKRGEIDGKIVAVISSCEDAYGLVRAKDANIAGYVVTKRGKPRERFEQEILGILKECRAQLVCLAGWMLILSPDFVKKAPVMMNIHPALLPAFGGKG